MKKLLITLLAATLFWQVNAAESTWLTDLPKAQAQAKAQNKMILMDFTGSDWCGWCIKFKKDVLDTPEFQEYAAKNLVLVELDYPQKKQQSDDLKKANAALQKQYNVDGFPTLVVLDKNGKEVGRRQPAPSQHPGEAFKPGELVETALDEDRCNQHATKQENEIAPCARVAVEIIVCHVLPSGCARSRPRK